MNRKLKYVWLQLAAVLFFISAAGIHAETFMFRPHVGLGHAGSSDSRFTGQVYHAGARFLLGAGGGRKYGIEVSYFDQNDAGDYTLLGFVLENKVGHWFHMSIGSVGYFNFANTTDNPVGLTTNLGWEPDNKKIKPLIAFRNDFIFYRSTVIVPSLTVGISW